MKETDNTQSLENVSLNPKSKIFHHENDFEAEIVDKDIPNPDVFLEQNENTDPERVQNADGEIEKEFDVITETLDEKDVNNFDRLENWVVKVFPKLKFTYSNHNDEYNISYEESQDRLLAMGIFITMIPCLIIIIQITKIFIATKSPRIVEPKIPLASPDLFCK